MPSIVDPWAGYARGAQTLRQVAEDRQSDRVNNMKIGKMEDEQAFGEGLKAVYAEAHAAGLPIDAANKKAADYAMRMGRADVATQLGSIETTEQKQSKMQIEMADKLAQLGERDPTMAKALADKLGFAYTPSAGGMQPNIIEKDGYTFLKQGSKLQPIGESASAKRAAQLEDYKQRLEIAKASRPPAASDDKSAEPTAIGFDPKYGVTYKIKGKDGLFVEDGNTGELVSKRDVIKGLKATSTTVPPPVPTDGTVPPPAPPTPGEVQGFKPAVTITGKGAFMQNMTPDINKNPAQVISEAREKEAANKSLARQTMTYHVTVPYLANMKQQYNLAKPLMDKINSGDTKLGAMTIAEFESKLTNNQERQQLNAILEPFVGESAKLASGSPLSISNVSEGARKEWGKIVDKSLPMSSLSGVVKTIIKEGEGKAKTLHDELRSTYKVINNGSDEGFSTPPPDMGFMDEDEKGKTSSGQPAKAIKSQAEYDALPSGSLWTDTKGNTRRKK